MNPELLSTASLRASPWGPAVTRILAAALEAVDPAAAVEQHLRREGDLLHVGNQTYDLTSYERVLLVGAGKAGVPMAPLVWGERATMNQMLWYTVILIGITVLPFTFGAFGVIYLASAVVLGLLLLRGIIRMRSAKDWTAPAWWVYKYSLLYLALLFVAMVADRKIPL